MHIHLIGIGGTGLSAIARLLLERGETVSGSDRSLSPLAQRLMEAGARVYAGHRAENVQGADLVIRSSAVPDDNVEVQAAHQANIPVLKRAEFLGRIMAGKLGIAVAGTHGKTTTAAMIAWLLSSQGRDPSFIIGGVSTNLNSNAHAGQGPEFVIEADEYDYMFLGLSPGLAVVTNVEHDHPDCFPTEEDFRQAFMDFAHRVVPPGALIVCGDDPGAAELAETLTIELDRRGVRTMTYGLDQNEYDYTADKLEANELGGFTFEFRAPEETPRQVLLRVPGEHNVRNALAALAVVHQLGADMDAAVSALAEFKGSGRRFEVRGEASGVVVIDDYAHHPTEIRATLQAARSRYPERRIWAVWQPHTYTRTRTLLPAFLEALGAADRVVVTEIYAARETPPEEMLNEASLAARLAESAPHLEPFAAPTFQSAVEHLLDEVRPGDAVLVLSAGNAIQISEELLKGLAQRVNGVQGSDLFGFPAGRLQAGVSLARYTSARVGGPADWLIEVDSADELAAVVMRLWELEQAFVILGGGSNVLVSDTGYQGVVVLNRARSVSFTEEDGSPVVWAESGANFGNLARQAARRGFAGLEWAGGIPGTVGGAVYGNAGAHGGDIAGSLLLAEILHLTPEREPIREYWSPEQLKFAYRSSLLKQAEQAAGRPYPGYVVLGAKLKLERSTPEAVQEKHNEFVVYRRRTQPPGASMGSMFKNPPGDFAGRLIEAAGQKGARVGGAEISSLHANFFINSGTASASDVYRLIQQAKQAVSEKFGIDLELEIGLLGEW